METTAGGEGDPKSDVNSSKRICRCCLTTEKRMRNAMEVQDYFMELAGINVMVSDGMPQWVCMECSALMRKGIAFKYKMLRAQSVLYDYLMKCAPGQLNPKDPDLTRYRAPNLSTTCTLIFDSTQEGYGFHPTLQVEKQMCKTELFDVPLLPMFENPCTALDSVEAAFSDFEDDPLERRLDKKKEKEDENADEDDVDDEDLEEDLEDEEIDEEEDLEDEEIDEDEDFDDEDIEETEDDSDNEPIVKKIKVDKEQSIKAEIMSINDRIPAPLEMSWTSENDEILIEFVKSNEALYNPKCKTYKIGVLKKKLWIDIGAILNKSDVECCKRWNYVRDYYIRRRGKRASGGEAARRRAALLAFLDAVPSTMRTGWAPAQPAQQPGERADHVKQEPPTTNFEHLWEQIRIGEQYSKMSPNAWTSAKEELLIDFVRRHEALYNPRCKDFRKPQVKQKLWCDIASLLNKTDADCSKRWCYVRDYYTRRKANPGALSTGKAAKRRAELLAFLDYVPPPQRAPLPPLDHPQESDTLKSDASRTPSESRGEFAGHSAQYRMSARYSALSAHAPWSAEQDEALITFVRRHQPLHNPRSKDFRKAQMKQRLWRAIGTRLGKSDSDCYKRWCYVRDYYIRRRGKAGVLCTGKAARSRAVLLAFLDAVPSPGKPHRALDNTIEKPAPEPEPEPEPEDAFPDYVEQQLDDYRDEYSKTTESVSWTWEDDETLIEFVRRHDALYNPKSRNSQLKHKLWCEIGAILNRTESSCCKRWCYVRDYYRRRSKLASGGEAARRRAVLLAFLDAVPSPQRHQPVRTG